MKYLRFFFQISQEHSSRQIMRVPRVKNLHLDGFWLLIAACLLNCVTLWLLLVVLLGDSSGASVGGLRLENIHSE
jgi:hypothetical protein